MEDSKLSSRNEEGKRTKLSASERLVLAKQQYEDKKKQLLRNLKLEQRVEQNRNRKLRARLLIEIASVLFEGSTASIADLQKLRSAIRTDNKTIRSMARIIVTSAGLKPQSIKKEEKSENESPNTQTGTVCANLGPAEPKYEDK